MSGKIEEFKGKMIPSSKENLQEIWVALKEGKVVTQDICNLSSKLNGCIGIRCSTMCILDRCNVKTFKEYMSQQVKEVKDEVIFQVGDRVECVDAGHCDITNGETYVISNLESNCDGDGFNLEENGSCNFYLAERFKLLTNKPKTTKDNKKERFPLKFNQTEGNTMNSTIKKVFAKDEFQLVERMDAEFGREFSENTFAMGLELEENKGKYITELVKREEVRKAQEDKE